MATQYVLALKKAFSASNNYEEYDVMVTTSDDDKVKMSVINIDDEYSAEIVMTRSDFDEMVGYVKANSK